METTNFDVALLNEIRNRRSKRAYSSRPIEKEKIKALFEAARWAPSSMNEQPWHYIYATLEESTLHQQLTETLNPSNQIWAKNAPLLVASLVRTNYSRINAPNGSAKYDVGSANAFLSLQATHMGLNVHQMGGFNAEKAREVLRVPHDFDVAVIMAIGYPGDPEELPENLKEREVAPRQRFTQDTFVMNTPFNYN